MTPVCTLHKRIKNKSGNSLLIRKVPAFTLLELLVVICITGILISLGSVILYNITRLYSQNEHTASVQSEVLLLESLLQKDLDAPFNDITVGESGLTIHQPGTKVNYSFYQDHVERETNDGKTEMNFSFALHDFSIRQNKAGITIILFPKDYPSPVFIFHHFSPGYSCNKYGYLTHQYGTIN